MKRMKTCYNRTTMNQASVVDDFWMYDLKLFDGRFAYYHDEPRQVRGKIHTSEESYELMGEYELDIRPIPTRRGTRTYIMLHPYMALFYVS